MHATPSLNPVGFITEPVQRLDQQLAHFFVAEPNQSYLHRDKVASLHTLLANINNNVEAGIMDLREKVHDYLSNKWDSVQIDVADVTEHYPGAAIDAVFIEMRVTVYEGNTSYTVNKLVNNKNSKFNIMLNTHNTGASS